MYKEAFVRDHELLSRLPVFYQPWYLDIFEIDWDVQLLAAGEDKWVFPYFIENIGGLKLSRPPHFTPYYGPVPASGNCDKKFSGELIAGLNDLSKKFSSISFAPFYDLDFSGIGDRGFDARQKITHILDLGESVDALRASLDSKTRRNIRKAEEELLLKTDDIDMDLYCQWLKRTVERRGDELKISDKKIKRYISAILDNRSGIATSVYNRSMERLAMNLTVYDRTSAYNILLVNNPEIKSNIASSALLWHAILEAKALGCELFDFEGSSMPGVADFFRRFGSRRVAFNSWQQVNSLVWKLKTKLLG